LSLFGVIGGGDSVKDFKFSESGSSSRSFMRKHTSNHSPEDSGRGSVMLDPFAGVMGGSLVQKFVEFNLVSEKGSRLVELVTTDDHDSLTIK
jgi:hypothetical protein